MESLKSLAYAGRHYWLKEMVNWMGAISMRVSEHKKPKRTYGNEIKILWVRDAAEARHFGVWVKGFAGAARAIMNLMEPLESLMYITYIK